ncbi:MAG: metallophosphoesterase [Betaproteobacteria bacterium]|nr:metallophosphoesterase [Betaproteobacteria bacterium]
MKPRLRQWLALASMAAAAFCTCATARAEPFSFALIGDVPYGHFERQVLPDLMAEIDQSDVAFVIHDGDIKDGGSPCTDDVYRDRLAVFQASRHPLIYVPGDNEWTDCRRGSNGGFDPVERLNRLREVFFPDNRSLGQRRMEVQRQSQDPAFPEYRENVRWVQESVLFVGVNIPGSANNIGRDAKPSAEYLHRSRANAAWLESAFVLARQLPARGIVIAIQANPDLEGFSEGRPSRGYADFLAQLLREAKAFAGEILLVHGDTHMHRIDQPLRDPHSGTTIENLTRLETYGSPFLGWVKVEVRDGNGAPLFRFHRFPFRVRN